VVAFAGFPLALVGCGDDDSSSGASSSTTPAATTPGTVTPTTPGAQPAGPTSAPAIPQVPGYQDETADGALKQGLRGPRVLALQKKLKALGYDVGTPDGLFGAKTRAAVVKFQTDKSLGVDGIVGPQTFAALDAACQANSACAAA
jgi:peptidoglycan hydrolase-like protein with peptidoglycan-binding domain